MVRAMDDDWHWRLVYLWLDGFRGRDERGRLETRFLQGRYAAVAREFLAMALAIGKPIPGRVRHKLAEHISEKPSDYSFFPSGRVLEFRFRSAGRRKDRRRDRYISECLRVLVEQGSKTESAVAEVASKFGLSRAEVFRVWGARTKVAWWDDFIEGSVPLTRERFLEMERFKQSEPTSVQLNSAID
jgi:hypothetical protein